MERISRTRKKREASSLQELGEKLVRLTEEQLSRIELPEDISAAVALARTIKKHGALKRQMQYIGVLMRKTNTAPIREAIEKLEEGSRRQVDLLKQVEHWRDELIHGNDALLDELLRALPDSEREQLGELVMKSREEVLRMHPSRSAARLLFRYLYKNAERIPRHEATG